MKTSDSTYKHFSTGEEVWSLINQVIDDNKKFYSKIRVRVVLVKTTVGTEELWRNGLCVFQTFLKTKQPKPVENQKYEKIQFLEYWIEVDQVESYLQQLKTGKISIGDQDILTTGCDRIGHFEFKTDGHSKNPIYYFQGDCNSRPNFASHEPVISSSLPVYPSVHSAIRHWSGLQNIDANSSLFGSVLLFFQECRAWVNEMEYLEDGISIGIQSLKEEIQGLRLKGVWEQDTNLIQFSETVSSEKVKIKAPEKATGFNFYLVDDEENLYDLHQEISHWQVGQKNILPFLGKKDIELEDKKIIKEALESGEGLQIEYKPFIKNSDKSKLEELVETTVAFLNTGGGRILIGVNNNCSVDGIEKGVVSGKLTAQKELEEYCGFVRQAIGSATDKQAEFSVTLHQYDGHWIVMANISVGKDKPYQSREKLMFFVRRGSNNKRATTEEIKTMINQSAAKNNPSELSGILAAFE